ncbi:MAG TPA: D-alanine--D-alanine ligase, partial [Vicinamibacteria bacterium]|nr:D-alanine--D-alanine ligase [Vicinamibacteria bacterium]
GQSREAAVSPRGPSAGIHSRREPPDALARRDQELPESFQEQIRNAAAAAAPATEAIAVAGGGARIDVAFLALHGPYGEDGTLQGMLDLIGIPYVGSGTLASALAMDKAMAKKVFQAEGIPVPAGLVVHRGEFHRDADTVAERAARAALPAVVKPARQGSSIGMSMVKEAAAMRGALEEAFEFDSVVLVEERLDGTELTVGVIGNRDLQALPVVEIVSKREFFDYRAKYDPGLSEEIVPARISDEASRAAQELALRAHRALGCRNLSRVDMMQTKARGPVVLEVNTMPGMTMNSLLPKAAQAAGIPFGQLLDRLIQLALEPDE